MVKYLRRKILDIFRFHIILTQRKTEERGKQVDGKDKKDSKVSKEKGVSSKALIKGD